MSFFLGKDSSDKPVLHITSGTRSASDLKSGQYSDTIFHSSREYIQYTAYNSVTFKRIGNGDVGYWDISNFNDSPESSYAPHRLTVPRAVHTAAQQGKGILLRVHLANTSYVAVPFIYFVDPYTTYNWQYQGLRYMTGNIAWYDASRDPQSQTWISPIPVAGGTLYDIATMLPKESLKSVDVLVLDWGAGYTFSPNKPSEIRVADNDIQLGPSVANRLSRYQYIRISGTEPIDSANKRMGIFDLRKDKTIGYMEFMNEPIPTGNTLELSPTRLVVKGRVQVDKNKATKTSRYKAAGSVLIPDTDTGYNNAEKTSEVVIRSKDAYKDTDLIQIYLGAPSVTEGGTPAGSFGPFLMGETTVIDDHTSYGFTETGIPYSTMYYVMVGPRTNGDYVVRVRAVAPTNGTATLVYSVRLSYLIFPEK